MNNNSDVTRWKAQITGIVEAMCWILTRCKENSDLDSSGAMEVLEELNDTKIELEYMVMEAERQARPAQQ